DARRKAERSQVIEEDERADHPPRGVRQHAADLETADVATALTDHELEHRIHATRYKPDLHWPHAPSTLRHFSGRSRIQRASMNRSAGRGGEGALGTRSAPVDLAQVRVHTVDRGAILDDLTGRIASAPRFFQRAAVCLDLSCRGTEPTPAEARAVLDAI